MKLEPVRYLYRINCILQDTNLGTHLVALTLSFIEMLRAKLESSVLLILIKKLTRLSDSILRMAFFSMM